MISNTQYALLVGIPTATAILAALVMSYMTKRFLRKIHANFDRLEATLDTAIRKPILPSAFAPRQ